MAETTEYNVQVRVSTGDAEPGIKRVQDGLTGIESTLGSIAESVGLYELGRQALDLTESYEKVENRLRTLVSGEEELRSTTAALFQVSEQSRGSFDATANVYARLARAAEGTGVSQQALLQATKALNEEAVIQGRSSEDLTGIVGQLSIALQTGTLNARALRLIFRDFPDLASALETQLGTTSQEFKKLGQEGKISGEDILKALTSASDVIDQRFGKTIVTVDSAMTNLRTNFQQFITQENESLGVTHAFAEGIQFASDHVNVLTGALAALGALLGGELLVKAVNFATRAGAGLQLVSSGALATAADISLIAAPFVELGYFITKIADEEKRASEAASGLGGELTKFGEAGLVVTLLQKKVHDLNAEVAANPGNERAQSLLKQYDEQLHAATKSLDDLSEAKKKSAAQDQQVTNAVKDLEDQNRLLGLGNQERKVQTELLRIEKDLRLQGVTLDPGKEKAITDQIRENVALQDLTKIIDSARAKHEDYERAVRLASEALVAGAISEREYQDVLKSGGIDKELDDLKQATRLLQESSKQREVETALRKAQTEIGRELTGAEQEAVVVAVRHKDAIAEQAKELQAINEPIQAYADKVAALNTLLRDGKITAVDYNNALSSSGPQGPKAPDKSLLEAAPGGGLKPESTGPVSETIAKLREEMELIGATNEERKLQTTLAQAAISANRALTADEVSQITNVVKATSQETEQLEGEKRALEETGKIHKQVLDSIVGDQAHYAGVLTQTTVAFERGEISAEQYYRALLKIDQEARQTDTTISGGLHRAFDQIGLELTDTGKLLETSVVDAFHHANDALVSFATTGKLNFKSFADSVIQDLARLALQQAEAGLFSAIFGGPGAAAANFIGPKQSAGGNDLGSGEASIVGEEGPELFIPRSAGSVIPADRTRGLLGGQQAPSVHVQPPQVHVHVTNVADPKEGLSHLNTREGEQHVLNIIARNKSAVRRNLA